MLGQWSVKSTTTVHTQLWLVAIVSGEETTVAQLLKCASFNLAIVGPMSDLL